MVQALLFSTLLLFSTTSTLRLLSPLVGQSLRASFAMYSSTSSGLIIGGDDDSKDNEEADDVIGRPVGPLPSVSSKLNFADEEPTDVKYDLWVVGAGTLGELVCKQ